MGALDRVVAASELPGLEADDSTEPADGTEVSGAPDCVLPDSTGGSARSLSQAVSSTAAVDRASRIVRVRMNSPLRWFRDLAAVGLMKTAEIVPVQSCAHCSLPHTVHRSQRLLSRSVMPCSRLVRRARSPGVPAMLAQDGMTNRTKGRDEGSLSSQRAGRGRTGRTRSPGASGARGRLIQPRPRALGAARANDRHGCAPPSPAALRFMPESAGCRRPPPAGAPTRARVRCGRRSA